MGANPSSFVFITQLCWLVISFDDFYNNAILGGRNLDIDNIFMTWVDSSRHFNHMHQRMANNPAIEANRSNTDHVASMFRYILVSINSPRANFQKHLVAFLIFSKLHKYLRENMAESIDLLTRVISQNGEIDNAAIIAPAILNILLEDLSHVIENMIIYIPPEGGCTAAVLRAYEMHMAVKRKIDISVLRRLVKVISVLLHYYDNTGLGANWVNLQEELGILGPFKYHIDLMKSDIKFLLSQIYIRRLGGLHYSHFAISLLKSPQAPRLNLENKIETFNRRNQFLQGLYFMHVLSFL